MKDILKLANEAYKQNRRIVAPLLGFSCVKMIGSNIKIAQQNYRVHFNVLQKVYEAFSPDIIFPLMDLAVEANALGRITHFAREKAPNVQKEEFKFDELDKLRAIDITTDVRTSNYAKVVNMMSVGLPENIVKAHMLLAPIRLLH
jgi:uroporphyrinogen decarboxylase